MRYAFPTTLLLAANVMAQTPPCITDVALPHDVVQRAVAADAARGGSATRHVKARVVIGATYTVEGTYWQAATVQRVQRDIDFANEVLANCGTGIQLQVCDPFEVVVAAGLFFVGPDPTDLFANRRPGYVNIFYVGSNGGFGGSAVLDMAMVTQSGTSSTLVHELGHILGLGHTDGGAPELVDGSNCATAGDHICDTPADPGLYLPGVVDLATCTYVGAMTDANGDTYQPIVNNIMSASPCPKDSLTPQQGAVMRYVLDSLHVELLASLNPVVIDPIPLKFCANDPPYTLSATPMPGTFSGPLVQGDQLIHFPNPAGDYSVTYTPDNAPDTGLFTLVDAYHVPNLYYYPGSLLPFATDSIRQSFIAGRSGSFAQVDAYLFSDAPQTFRMRLYEGMGMALTLLHDTTAAFASTDTSWVRFAVPSTVACVAGSTYSYVITAQEPFTTIAPVGGYLAWGSNSMGNFNMMFRTWVRTDMPCQQVTRYYELYQVPARAITNLAEAYCHDDAQDHVLAVDLFDVTGSTVQVDGEVTGQVNPQALGVGTHEALHIYTVNGCTDTLAQVFAVEGPMAFSFPGIPGSLCTTDAPVELVAEPPLGQFLVDGEPATVLDPQALTAGMHVVTHVHEAALDTVLFPDQVCCVTGYHLNTFLHDDTLSWQSFVPEHGGALESIRIPLELFNTPRQLVVRLLEGIGTGGNVLHTDTITASTHDGTLLTNTGLQMTAGADYTWSIRKVSDGNAVLPPMLGITWGDHYVQGYSSAPGTPDTTGDLRFQEYITQRTFCQDTTELQIQVDICSSVNEALAHGVVVGPNPVGDQLMFTTGDAPMRYALYAADGREVLNGRGASGARTSVRTAGLASGCYLLRLWFGDAELEQVVRVVKEE